MQAKGQFSGCSWFKPHWTRPVPANLGNKDFSQIKKKYLYLDSSVVVGEKEEGGVIY